MAIIMATIASEEHGVGKWWWCWLFWKWRCHCMERCERRQRCRGQVWRWSHITVNEAFDFWMHLSDKFGWKADELYVLRVSFVAPGQTNHVYRHHDVHTLRWNRKDLFVPLICRKHPSHYFTCCDFGVFPCFFTTFSRDLFQIYCATLCCNLLDVSRLVRPLVILMILLYYNYRIGTIQIYHFKLSQTQFSKTIQQPLAVAAYQSKKQMTNNWGLPISRYLPTHYQDSYLTANSTISDKIASLYHQPST